MASRVLRAALLGCGIASLASLAEAEGKVAHISPSLRTKLNEADRSQKLSTTKEPRVKISGYLYDWNETINIFTGSSYGNFGFSINTWADVFASLESPAFKLERADGDWLIVNPHLFGEASIAAALTVNFYIISLTFTFKIVGFKFSPLDFQFA